MKIDNQDIQITDDGDIISISLPPSERGWAVVISKGVHSSSQIRVTENRPGESPALQLSMRTNIFSTDDARCDVEAINVGVKTLDLGSEGRVSIPKSQSLEPPPSHVRGCSPQERFRVAKDIRLKYPPFSVGWRDLSWVVVIRGRDVGVFHEYWARIWPLIKFDEHKVIPGACWKKAEGEDDALRKWAIAVDEGAVERIDTVVVPSSVFYTKEPTSSSQ